MGSDFDDQFQYMMEVDNGWVHGLEYSPDQERFTPEDLKDANTAPETMLTSSYPEPEYDQQFDNFYDLSLNADEVKIDTTMGIVDVFQGDNLLERYSLVGILENKDGEYEIVFGGLNHSDEDVHAKTDNSVDWTTEMSAAYQAIHNLIDKPETDTETVSLYEEDTSSSGVSTMNPEGAREVVKAIDDFIAGLQKDPAQGIEDFEQNGQVTIGPYDHYGSARNYDAAKELKTDLNRLNFEGLLDYETETLTQNANDRSVELKIEKEFLDGNNSLRDDVKGLSDFDVDTHQGRMDLTDQRM